MLIDIAGRKIGLLLCIKETDVKSGSSKKWECLCDCGNKVLVSYNNLIRNRQKSCGCYRKTFMKTHGKSGDRIYILYKAMLSRVKYNQYKNHKGLGIVVCDRWLESFENFLEDMGNSYEDGLELDRRNVHGNYEPSNCRWVNKSLQAFNKRKGGNNRSGKTGVYKSVKSEKWVARITKDGKEIYLGTFYTFEDAINARQVAELKYFGQIRE